MEKMKETHSAAGGQGREESEGIPKTGEQGESWVFVCGDWEQGAFGKGNKLTLEKQENCLLCWFYKKWIKWQTESQGAVLNSEVSWCQIPHLLLNYKQVVFWKLPFQTSGSSLGNLRTFFEEVRDEAWQTLSSGFELHRQFWIVLS